MERLLNPSSEMMAGRSAAQQSIATELQRRVQAHSEFGTPISSGEGSSDNDDSSEEN